MKFYKFIICGFTKIYLYCFYIPELIRLANDVQITQVQELLIQTKLLDVFNLPLGRPITIEKCTTSGGRTKEANEKSFVFVHQHGGDDVT